MMTKEFKAAIAEMGGTPGVAKESAYAHDVLADAHVNPLAVLIAIGIDAGMNLELHSDPGMLCGLAKECIEYGFELGRKHRGLR
jgi:hypothetical protein